MLPGLPGMPLQEGYHAAAEKEGYIMSYTFQYIRGHIEVYDERGCFLFSADTEREAREDIAADAA